jgi:putative tricarboxylic transport membrane protein
VFIGVFFGTLVGVLPGLGSPAAIALLLPLTIQLPPASALIMLAGIYYGSEYGGKTTSILMNMPGESGAIMTAIDGYPMAKMGQAGKALGIAAVASFVGGTLGLIALTFLAKPLASLAIGFGPPELFGLVVLGLSTVVLMSGKSVLKGLIAAVTGMMFALVGVDILAGEPRFIFGQSSLLDGMSFVSLVVGVFAMAEVMINVEQRTGKPLFSLPKKLREYFPSFGDIRRSGFAMGQGSIIGFLVGVVPGAGATIASFLAYTFQKRTYRNPER